MGYPFLIKNNANMKKTLTKLSTFQLMEAVIERKGAYLISDITIDEIENGSTSSYGGHHINLPPMSSIQKYIGDKYVVKPCNFTEHKLIVRR